MFDKNMEERFDQKCLSKRKPTAGGILYKSATVL